MKQPLRILLIEDDPGDAGLIGAYLRPVRFSGLAPRIVVATSLGEARGLLLEVVPDLILLDLALPDSAGLATVTTVHGLAPGTPIVVLSGHRDAEFEADVLEAGAQDYLVKGEFDSAHIGRAIRHARTRARLEARLKLQDAALRAVAHGIVITGADATIQWANPAFSQMTGYSLAESLGHKPKDLIHSGLNDAALYESLWRTIMAGQVWRGELVNKRKDGSLYDEELAITPVRDAQGVIQHFVAFKQDISERKASEEKIRQLAFYDALTNLPNRRMLLDRLQQALAVCGRSHHVGALLFIDLDDFKGLNDTLGHDIGDLLLIQVARRLAECVREGDTVSRLGGDEFVVMLEDLSGNLEEAALQAEGVGEKIIAALNRPYDLNGNEQHSTPSIGITLFDDSHDSIDDLLKRADLAMYQAKEAGRNTLRFFDHAMQARVEARAMLEAELRRALRDNQFQLHYQPQVDAGGRVTGAEALLRWNHPQRGLVTPGEFITLAEESGLIVSLGHWVLEEACRQLTHWGASPSHVHLTLAVNVSARQFRHPDFVDQVLAVVEHTRANPLRLKLELTESLLLDNVEATAEKMAALKAHGIGFALDDFGTGYSSLTYLKRLPLDQLKIDRSFVRDVLSKPNDAAIARGIIALGLSLGLPVIAEGVETMQQRDFLVSHGCVNFQGYLFGKPMPAGEFPG
ncbi:MAG: EAL domain-containing protein [Gallionellaceae bacterium]|nr:EAL domain-containing protein [Gallionellaceae bacterium]